MAYAETASFGSITLSVEFDPSGAAGTYSTICGIKSWTYTETTNLEETEVPDCDDPDLPYQIETSVRSVGARATFSGVWAKTAHQKIFDWVRGGNSLNCRVNFHVITDSGAATDTETLTGPARLVNRVLEGNKGQKWNSNFELVFDGLPVPALKGP